MATIVPFGAVRFNPSKINGTLESVVAPPYDVISVAQQDGLYKKSPHNVVRLILGRQYDGDSPSDNRYTRAARTLKEWLIEGILVEDATKAFYVYEQEFEVLQGYPPVAKKHIRRGVLTALKLEPFGTGCVYPHEETFAHHKQDRLLLTRACRANFSPIFGLAPDKEGLIARVLGEMVAGKKPDAEVKESAGVVNRMWIVRDKAQCQMLSNIVEPEKVFIADGHHRYETACNYRNERQLLDSTPNFHGLKPYDFCLMMLVPMSDPGLRILPTHRMVVRTPEFSALRFLGATGTFFEKKLATAAELAALSETTDGPVRVGIDIVNGEKAILTLKPAGHEELKRLLPAKSDMWRELDVAVLHELLLKSVPGYAAEQHKESILYTKDVHEVITRMAHGGKGAEGAECSMGFILRPTRIDQVKTIAEGGEKMPHKSTYFAPKLLSGLVMRRL